MSKITKWVDLHPRAERLIDDANQHAFICGAYMGMDAVSSANLPQPAAPVRNPNHIQKGEYLVLPKSAVSLINRALTAANNRTPNEQYLARAVARQMAEGMDAIDVLMIWTDDGWMPTPDDLDAIAELEDQADIDAGNDNAYHPMRRQRAKKAKLLRTTKREKKS